MLGAIIGDIVGSEYEFCNIKTKAFPFFGRYGNYTDDSILTLATADWLLHHEKDVADYYADYAVENPCPMGGYGGMFRKWIRIRHENHTAPAYNSCGNGSAMRIAPVGWAFDTEEETLAMAKVSAECTHNHPGGIAGAQATALCIFMARNGCAVDEIRKAVTERFGYDLSMSVDEIRPKYSWDGLEGEDWRGGTCQGSVPQAIICALEATDYRDAIRNAISIGGDSDTIGCITGGIAEALFGIPKATYDKGLSYLPDNFKKLVTEFETKYSNNVII